jgi:phosphoribosylanthranilate isomerase
MNLKVKICGMRYSENILEVAALRSDFMGFIFYAQSPRCVQPDFKIPMEFPSSIKRVGVFVNEDSDKIINTVRQHDLDFVQLHGDESVKQCLELKKLGVSVIKAFSIGEDFYFKIIDPYKKVVDFFLFDTKGKFYGGNAAVFDWNIMNQYDQEVPFFLSGGLSPQNIHGIKSLSGMNIHALDFNSGVETKPGVKDTSRISQVNTILNSIS